MYSILEDPVEDSNRGKRGFPATFSKPLCCHSPPDWIPACAGMTGSHYRLRLPSPVSCPSPLLASHFFAILVETNYLCHPLPEMRSPAKPG